jgi:hypothetical protein
MVRYLRVDHFQQDADPVGQCRVGAFRDFIARGRGDLAHLHLGANQPLGRRLRRFVAFRVQSDDESPLAAGCPLIQRPDDAAPVAERRAKQVHVVASPRSRDAEDDGEVHIAITPIRQHTEDRGAGAPHDTKPSWPQAAASGGESRKATGL